MIGASKVVRDITERKLAETAEREADPRKDEFLALLAHELAILWRRWQWAASAAAGGQRRGDRRAGACHDGQATRAHGATDRRSADIARVGQNKMELRRTRVPLAAVIDPAVETAQPAIEAERHEFSVSLPAEPLFWTPTSPGWGKFSRTFSLNTAKYTRRGGQIWLTAERQGENAVVSVRDDGIGIPADALPRLRHVVPGGPEHRASHGGTGHRAGS